MQDLAREKHLREGWIASVMKGREILHDCEPTVTEQKISVALNYYVRGDTWRHDQFNDFVYEGVPPSSVAA